MINRVLGHWTQGRLQAAKEQHATSSKGAAARAGRKRGSWRENVRTSSISVAAWEAAAAAPRPASMACPGMEAPGRRPAGTGRGGGQGQGQSITLSARVIAVAGRTCTHVAS
jgi:hypothetical protein